MFFVVIVVAVVVFVSLRADLIARVLTRQALFFSRRATLYRSGYEHALFALRNSQHMVHGSKPDDKLGAGSREPHV